MNRMGPLVLVLATANALAAAAMAGAVAAVVIFIGIIAAGFLWFRTRPTAAEEEDAQPAGPVGRRAMVIGRQGAQLLVRLDGRDGPARMADGTAMLGYGDPVRVVAVEGAVLVVRPEAGA
jgi:membrane protein implicated in regulation of membrane protease activity